MKLINLRQEYLALVVVLSLFSMVFLMARMPLLVDETSHLALAISIDLVLTIPLIYFLLIRKTKVPNFTSVPLMIAGLLFGFYILPEADHFFLDQFKTWALPIVELGVISLVIFKVSRLIKKYKYLGYSGDFFEAIKTASQEILPPRVAILLSTELAVFYYGFFHWRIRKLENHEFSYHKNGGGVNLMIAIIGIVGIETFVLHKLLLGWSFWLAWIVVGLSVYTGLQIFGFLRSLSKRPIILQKESVLLRYGILSEVEIPLHQIDRIELSERSLDEDENIKYLSPFGAMEGHNCIVYLKSEIDMRGLYGFKKSFKSLAFFVDEKVTFVESLKDRLV